MSHAILPPSSSEQWVNCPGWVEMSLWYPEDEESEDAMIGTAVHELGAWILLEDEGTPYNTTAGNGVIYTDEMIECAELYAGYCLGLIEKALTPDYAVEIHIPISYVHAENSGTPDFVLVDRESRTIHIVDYKNGRGVVEPYENWQLLDYLVGVMFKYGMHELADDEADYTMHLTIVQPRAFSGDGVIRTWQIMGREVRPYATRLRTAAGEALSGNAKCHAGEHCRYCSALHACPTALQTGMLLFDVAGRATPVELSAQAMGLQYEIIKAAGKLLSALEASYEAQITSKLRTGTNIPGWSLQGKVGNLEWTAPLEEVFAFGDYVGIDLRKAPEAITPTQAKNKGLDAIILAEYASRPNKGFKLTKFDDSRISRIF